MEVAKLQLKNKVTWPIPTTKKYEYIPEVLAIKEDASRFRLRNNRFLAPMTFTYTTYKICARKFDDPEKKADLIRRHKLDTVIRKVKGEIKEAKQKLKELMLTYQKMVATNKKDVIAKINKLAEDIDTLKGLKKTYRSYVMACHSLLYIRDSMAEAVRTYAAEETFMEEVLGQMTEKQDVLSIHAKYKELEKLKQEITDETKQEVENQATLVNHFIAKQGKSFQEASLLHIRAKALETALKDLDCRISVEEQFMYTAHSWNERAWRHYSFINLTLFDLMKYMIEARDRDPQILEMSLWDKIQFLRREHLCNLEVLKRLGVPKEKLILPTNRETYQKMEARKRTNKMEASKELRKKFGGHIPRMYKLLLGRLRLGGKRSKKTGIEFLKMLRAPKAKERGVFALINTDR